MRIALIILSLSLVIALVFYQFSRQENWYNWYPSYDETKAQPYSTGVLAELLQERYQLKTYKNDSEKSRPDAWLSKVNQAEELYFFIGRQALFTEKEAETLIDFAQQGGQAFLAVEELPDSLMQFLLYFEDCGWSQWAETQRQQRRGRSGRYLENIYRPKIELGFMHPSLSSKNYQYHYRREQEFQAQNWAFLPAHYFCNQAQKPLTFLGHINLPESEVGGLLQNNFNNEQIAQLGLSQVEHYTPSELFRNPDQSLRLPVFFRFQIGQGAIYFHTLPQAFTNLYLLDLDNFEYLQRVFDHFGPIKTLHWDKSIREQRIESVKQRPRNSPIHRSPMDFIFAQKPLRWAWYLVLGFSVLYLLFMGKRRQRIVPVLADNRNTSLYFVKSLARLYFLQQNHANIFEKQMQFFLAHIRRRYQLNTSEISPELIKKIIQRSGVEAQYVQTIFQHHQRYLDHQNKHKGQGIIRAETLNLLYYSIQRFHQMVRQKELAEMGKLKKKAKPA